MLFINSKEKLNNHIVIINAHIHEKVKHTRTEFLNKLSHVKYLRTQRNCNLLCFYIHSFETFINFKKIHSIVNSGKFDFTDEFIFAIAIEPNLFNWFKTTDYNIIEKQIVCWLAGLYFFNFDKRKIMEEQIYPPTFEEILRIIDNHYKNINISDFQDLNNLDLDNLQDFFIDAKKAEEIYLEICKNYYSSTPPEFLNLPYDYSRKDGWGLNNDFSFNIITAYFNQKDWERVFVKGILTDDMGRVEGRSDLWEKWKHTFGTYDYRNNFIYSYYHNVENKNSNVNEKRKRGIIPKDIKNTVWQRDKGECVECGSKENLEFDHIIPFVKGGANTYRNLQLLCETCNRKKNSNF